MSSTARLGRSDMLRPFAGVLIVFVIALAIRLAHFENEPITDELYHLLAAKSWAGDGNFSIADGEYRRAFAFTSFIGMAGFLSDWSLSAIRIACIVIGSLLVAAIYLWTRLNAGSAEALTAALLLAIMPTAIFLSQYIRFYGLHALLYFLLAWCTWSLVTTSQPTRRYIAIAVTLPLALLALHLQVTTLVGIAALASWAVLMKREDLLRLVPRPSHRVAIAGVLLFGIILAGWLAQDRFLELLQTYRESALWNSSDNALYYFNEYRDDFGFLWALAPAAAFAALVARPMPAFFCVWIFGVAFVVQSFGGMRSERFMFYALPFLLILWGIAAVILARAFSRAIAGALSVSAFAGRYPAMASVIPGIIVAGTAAFALLTVPAIETAAKMTLGIRTNPPDYWDRYRTNWAAVTPHLQVLAADVDAVIATQPLHAIWYLGDVDYAMNATSLADIAPRGTHAIVDPRTGRLVFDNLATLRAIIDCRASGLVIVHGPALLNESRVGDSIAEYLASELREIALPVRSDMHVFRWSTPSPQAECNFD